MRIIDGRTGELLPIPFFLGERGDGRWQEEVQTSNRPGQAPTGPQSVGYACFGGHVILTRDNGQQRGLLLRVNTYGIFTKYSNGKVVHKGGKANLLTSGRWAVGGAGNSAHGPDELWHVEEQSLFEVTMAGGEGKGWGVFYLFVTKTLRTVFVKEDRLCQLLANDEDPELSAAARQFKDLLPESVRKTLVLAEQLDAQIGVAQTGAIHFAPQWETIEDAIKRFRITIPAAMGKTVAGVSGVSASTLVPGPKGLVVIEMGPAGGKRYGLEVILESGLTRIAGQNYDNSVRALAIVENPLWMIAGVHRKDKEVFRYQIIDGTGSHTWDLGAPTHEIHTQGWMGIPPVSPTWEVFKKVFGL